MAMSKADVYMARAAGFAIAATASSRDAKMLRRLARIMAKAARLESCRG